MNETPAPQIQPEPVIITTPAVKPPSQALSTWSLVLGIVALVLGIVLFISIPAAIVAIILGIIVLMKHHPGKGKALAGIITGGVALIFIPILVVFTVVAYNGVTERANELTKQANIETASKEAAANSDDESVDTDCYSYAIPSGYELGTTVNCTTNVNIPNGDILTRITVKGNTGTIGTLEDVVATFNKSLKASDPNSEGVIDHEQLSSGGNTVYYVSYKDANGLLFGNYIIPATTSHVDENGKPITGYTIAGYTYNSGLKGIVTSVLDSLTLK